MYSCPDLSTRATICRSMWSEFSKNKTPKIKLISACSDTEANMWLILEFRKNRFMYHIFEEADNKGADKANALNYLPFYFRICLRQVIFITGLFNFEIFYQPAFNCFRKK